MLFGRRQGRAVKAYKQKLLLEFLPALKLSVQNDQVVCPAGIKGYEEVFLEVGFGDGTHLVSLAQNNPDILIFGCEPFINGVGSCLAKIQETGVQNIRIYDGAVQTLLLAVADGYFSKMYVLFPDPWPKKRHFKRRLLSAGNMPLFFSKLKAGGDFFFATDHEGYREWVQELIATIPELSVLTEGHVPPKGWVETAFQRKGQEAGRAAYFMHFIKKLL